MQQILKINFASLYQYPLGQKGLLQSEVLDYKSREINYLSTFTVKEPCMSCLDSRYRTCGDQLKKEVVTTLHVFFSFCPRPTWSMYFNRSSFSCLRFIFCGTTAIEALEELEEEEDERDLDNIVILACLVYRTEGMSETLAIFQCWIFDRKLPGLWKRRSAADPFLLVRRGGRGGTSWSSTVAGGACVVGHQGLAWQ